MPETVTVYVTGTCTGGHTVGHNLQATVPQGYGGIATANGDCGACGSPVLMTGSFSTRPSTPTREDPIMRNHIAPPANTDPTEPRWTCSNSHSCAANTSQCTMPGCGATR